MFSLARFLSNAFNRFASFLIGIKGGNLILAVAYISFFTATAVFCYTAISAAISALTVGINLSGWALNFLLVGIAFLPDNLIEGLSLVFSTEICIFLLHFNSLIFKAKIDKA